MFRLEEVVKAFEIWRSERKYKNEAIPEHLWTLTKGLVPYYKKAHIQRALRVSGGQFNKRCAIPSAQEIEESVEGGFAAARFFPEPQIQDDLCELTLKGAHKNLQIKTNMKHLGSILSLVEGYL